MSEPEALVEVKKPSDGKRFLLLQWRDPETGKRRYRSAKTRLESVAQRRAAQLEAEILAGK